MSMPARLLAAIAEDTLRCALSWEPDARLIGNVTAREIVKLAAQAVATCPKCGAEAWCNIDCDLCELASGLLNGEA